MRPRANNSAEYPPIQLPSAGLNGKLFNPSNHGESNQVLSVGSVRCLRSINRHCFSLSDAHLDATVARWAQGTDL